MPLRNHFNRWFPPSDPPPDPPAGAVISADLDCRDCHYNLKTLSAEASCPECGLPIKDSVFLLEFLKPLVLPLVLLNLSFLFVALYRPSIDIKPHWEPSTWIGLFLLFLPTIPLITTIYWIRIRRHSPGKIGVAAIVKRLAAWLVAWIALTVLACGAWAAAPSPVSESVSTRMTNAIPTYYLKRLVYYSTDHTSLNPFFSQIGASDRIYVARFKKETVEVSGPRDTVEYSLLPGESVNDRAFIGEPLRIVHQADGCVLFQRGDGKTYRHTGGALVHSPQLWPGPSQAPIIAMILSTTSIAALSVSIFVFAQLIAALCVIFSRPKSRYLAIGFGIIAAISFWMLSAGLPLLALLEWRANGAVPTPPNNLLGTFIKLAYITMTSYFILSAICSLLSMSTKKIKESKPSWESVTAAPGQTKLMTTSDTDDHVAL
jgi:hypothetical protein